MASISLTPSLLLTPQMLCAINILTNMDSTDDAVKMARIVLAQSVNSPQPVVAPAPVVAPVATPATSKPCRDMALCVPNGARIRHRIGSDNFMIGVYNRSYNLIQCDGKSYKSPSGFAAAHKARDTPDINPCTNGWIDCQCEIGGQWRSMRNLPPL